MHVMIANVNVNVSWIHTLLVPKFWGYAFDNITPRLLMNSRVGGDGRLDRLHDRHGRIRTSELSTNETNTDRYQYKRTARERNRMDITHGTYGDELMQQRGAYLG